MRISKLKLVNFRNHRMSDIDFRKKITFVYGPNGAGKTSILDAICYLLLGRNIRTSKAGAGSNDLITFGEGKAFIEGEVNDLKVTRTIPHTLVVNNWTEGLREQQKKLEDAIGVGGEQIDVCINSTLFTQMSSRDKKNFLFEIMGVDVSTDMVRNEFIAWGKENSVRTPDALIDGAIEKYDLEFGDQAHIEKTSDMFIEKRKQLKKAIKEAKVKLEKPEGTLPDGINIDSEEKVRTLLDDLKKKNVDIVGKIREYRGRLQELDKIANAQVVSDDVNKLMENRNKYDATMRKIVEEKAQLNAELQMLEKRRRDLGKWNGKCTLSDAIQCSISQDDIMDIIEQTDGKIEALREKISEIFSREEKGTQLISENENKIRKSADGVTQKDKEKAAKEIEKLKVEYGIDKLSEEAKELEGRIDKGEDMLSKILGEKSKIRDVERTREQLEKDEKELKEIEILCDGFGPNGLKSIILRRVLSPIRERVKGRMLALSRNEIEMDIRLEGDDLYLYLIEDGIEKEFNYLSRSEQIRVQIVLQDVIAGITGLKFLIVDEVDVLDKNNRKAFVQLLKGIADEYDSIIALCTGESYGMDEEIHEIDLG